MIVQVVVAVVVIEVVIVEAFSAYMLIFLKYRSLSKILSVFENQKFYKYLAQAKKRNSHKKSPQILIPIWSSTEYLPYKKVLSL